MTKLKATTTVALTGSMLGYYKAQCGNYAAYGSVFYENALTAKEAESKLSEMMKKRRGVK